MIANLQHQVIDPSLKHASYLPFLFRRLVSCQYVSSLNLAISNALLSLLSIQGFKN